MNAVNLLADGQAQAGGWPVATARECQHAGAGLAAAAAVVEGAPAA